MGLTIIMGGMVMTHVGKSNIVIRILSIALVLLTVCSAAMAQSDLGQNELKELAKVQYIGFLESRSNSELVEFGYLYPEEKVTDLEGNVSIGGHFKEYKWTTRPDLIDSSKSLLDMSTYDQDSFLMEADGQARAVISLHEVDGAWTLRAMKIPDEYLVDVIGTHYTNDGPINLIRIGIAKLLELSKGEIIEYYPADENAVSIFKFQKDDQGDYIPLNGGEILEVLK